MQALLTVDEVARMLGVTRARCYQLVRENLLPCVRLGRQVRIAPEALEEWRKTGGRPLAGGWRREPQ